MSLFLRVFEILMMCTLCYSYHETMRSQYRSSLAKILPYLITGFFLILISPWLSITILRILLAALLCLSILLYRNDWQSHLFFIGDLIAGAIIVQIISTQNLQTGCRAVCIAESYFSYSCFCFTIGMFNMNSSMCLFLPVRLSSI